MATATPHATAITNQPPFCPLVLLSTTFATTPSPRRMSSIVPIASASSLCMGRTLDATSGSSQGAAARARRDAAERERAGVGPREQVGKPTRTRKMDERRGSRATDATPRRQGHSRALLTDQLQLA